MKIFGVSFCLVNAQKLQVKSENIRLEKSPAAKNEEKRMFSRAIKPRTRNRSPPQIQNSLILPATISLGGDFFLLIF